MEKLETTAGKLFPASTPSFADCPASSHRHLVFASSFYHPCNIVTVNMLAD